jgi:hypothetical protein
MVPTVGLFMSMKNDAVVHPLGLRRLRRAPACGQLFQIPLDGRAVRARITRFPAMSDVYAEEI